MAIQTVWSIDHKCGHTQERDLSDRAADKRAGFASWLSSTDCFECYKKKNRASSEKKRAAERAARREAELAEAAVYEKRSALDVLSGSEKQVPWAREIRVRVLAGLYGSVESGDRDEAWFEDAVLRPARLIATARWWIDNKDFGVEAVDDWVELLAAGAASTASNENLAST